MLKIANFLLGAALLIVTLLWFSSYTHHSSIGMDHDFKYGDRILHKFYRINWTGHGSILIGYGSTWKDAAQHHELEKFDPAHALLKPKKQAPEPPTLWNKIGFWYIDSPTPKPTFWLGVPSWLPVILLLGLWRFRPKTR